MEGPHAEDYAKTLQGYHTILMGRSTYEAAYAFGMTPGANPYPWAQVYVLSNTLDIQPAAGLNIVREDALAFVTDLKNSGSGDIYLCGGGKLAGTLAAEGLIDNVSLKINPAAGGQGVPLFGGTPLASRFKLETSKTYENGVVLLNYSKA
jgi:dihydrofolate reductase